MHAVPEEGIRFHGTEGTDGCELLYGCWKLNPGSQEQLVLLTSEPSVLYLALIAQFHLF